MIMSVVGGMEWFGIISFSRVLLLLERVWGIIDVLFILQIIGWIFAICFFNL
jgi:hypothetical protein